MWLRVRPGSQMIIHAPAFTQTGNETLVSARIQLRTKRRGVPSELWFRFTGTARVSADADPFVVALLLLAMQNDEPIEIRGTLSRKLFNGLQQYQHVYHSWFPDRFKMIEIRPEGLREDVTQEAAGAACAFSGGVDSFYTLLALRSQVTHAIFMAGFDMPLNLTDSIGELVRSYSTMMKDFRINLIVGSTNVRNFVNSVDWTNAHGQALAATALFYKDSWSKFYIPSSYSLDNYPKWGSHPSLDHLLSTESLQLIHHGAHANRVRKLETVSKAPESYDRLRVCWIQDIGLRNCGECEKCIRTMVALDILGKLPRYSTFGPRKKLNRHKVRQLMPRTHQARLFARELMREAVRRGKYLNFFDLGYSLLRRELFYRSLT